MNLVQGSNLSNAEFLHMNGTLDAERIEALLNLEAVEFSEAHDHINEAMAKFPKEDVLSEIMKDLAALAKKMRKGDNRDELERIIEALGEVDTRITNDADLGRDELEKAADILCECY